jgi:histidinol phosphatase-like PHP family hydrolase
VYVGGEALTEHSLITVEEEMARAFYTALDGRSFTWGLLHINQKRMYIKAAATAFAIIKERYVDEIKATRERFHDMQVHHGLELVKLTEIHRSEIAEMQAELDMWRNGAFRDL